MFKKKQFLKNLNSLPLILIVSLLVFVPSIELEDLINSIVTSKTILFGYFCILIILALIIQHIGKSNFQISFSKMDFFLLLILIYDLLNQFWIQSVATYSIRYYEYIGLLILYVFLRTITLPQYIWILITILISGCFQTVLGFLQLLGLADSNHALFSVTGTFFNPGPYAGFLSSVWIIGLVIYIFKNEVKKFLLKNEHCYGFEETKLLQLLIDYVTPITLISILLIIPATHSRAAWVSIMISSLVIFEMRYKLLSKLFLTKAKKLKLVIIVTGAFLILIGSLTLYSLKKESANGRAFIWEVGIEMVKGNPIFGIGFDRFKADYMNYQAQYFIENDETAKIDVADNTIYAFNDLLQNLVEGGLMGILFLIVTIIYTYKLKSGIDNYFLSIIAKLTLLTIGIFACFSYPMHILPIKLIMVVSIALLSCLDYKFKQFSIESKQLHLIYKGLTSIFLVVCLVSFTLNVRERHIGYSEWKMASVQYQVQNYEDAVSVFQTLYPIFKRDGEFLMTYGKSLSMIDRNVEAIKILNKAKNHLNNTIIETTLGNNFKDLKQYDKAVNYYENAKQMVPSRIYPSYLMAKLYEEMGDSRNAKLIAQKILAKKLKVTSTATKQIKVEMLRILENSN